MELSYRTVIRIMVAVEKARDKHPRLLLDGENIFNIVSIITEELGEFAQAVNDKKDKEAYNELLDIIAVCVRACEEYYRDMQ